MRLDRLLEIVIILLNRRQVTARELAARFAVSVRTVYRDIEAINTAGVPVVATQGQGGGFTIMENYRIDRQILSLDDMAAIAAALRGMHGALDDDRSRQALEKISSLVPGERSDEFAARTDMLVIQPHPWCLPPAFRETLRTVQCALVGSCLLEFKYHKIGATSVRRLVEPHTLLLSGSVWYLHAWCRERDAWRLFRLSRMRDARAARETFVRRPVDIEALSAGGVTVPAEEVRLRLAPSARTRAEDAFGLESTVELPDGQCEISLNWPVDDWLVGFLLGFGPDIDVVAPPALRELVRARAAETLARYSLPAVHDAEDGAAGS